MKKKRNILLGLTFVFLTSTVIVWADPYNNENTLQRDSEFIQENTLVAAGSQDLLSESAKRLRVYTGEYRGWNVS